VFLAAMLVSTVLEIAMIARRQHALAAATYAGSDVLRAALLSVPAALTGRLNALLAGAILFGVLRCIALAWYLSREFGRRLKVDWRSMLLQLRYAVPFGAAVAVGVVQINFHQYAVAAWFDPATFVIYSVGCLQVPVVDILATSVANVMMVTMSEKIRRQEPALAIWHRTVEQLAYLFVPLAIVLILSAREVIVILFTPAFAASAPIFAVVAATIALGALPVDAVLRVHAQTRFLLVLNVLQLAFVALAISWSIATWHLVGAVLVTAVGLAGAKALAVTRIAAIMRVPLRRILPWRSLAGVLSAGAIAAVPVLVMKSRVPMPPAIAVASATALYGAGYFGLMALLRSMGAVFVSPVSEPAA
jgi:O-antigen/teichoic acid export membrane protein